MTILIIIQINPQHTVPTIVDHDNGDFALWESRVIMTYLVNKSDPNHKLYPTSDVKVRATIDRWLSFDLGTLYGVIGHPIVYPTLMQGLPVDPTKIPPLKEKLAYLDAALSKSKYLASNDNYTLADLSVLSTLSMLDVVDIDYSELTHLTKWYNGLKKELPYYNEVHQAGIDALKAWAEKSKKKAAGK